MLILENSERTKRLTLIITCGASFIAPFLMNALNLAIPNIGETYQASTAMLGWVVNSFLLTSAAFLLPFGRLADIVGRKKIFLASLLLSSVTSFLCVIATSIEVFIIFRVLQGISGAMGFGTVVAIMTSAYPAAERGKVLGFNAAAVYIGLSLGPVVGGFLTFNWGWVSIFIFGGISNLILFLLALMYLKGEWAGSPGAPFDWQGSAVYIIGLVAFLYGLSSLQEHWIFWLVLVCGLLLLVVFVRRELNVDNPLLPLRQLLRNRVFAFSSLATLINYSATFAISFLLSIYLQSVLGFDSRIAGFILLVQPVLMVIVSPLSGRLSDRVSPNIVSAIGMFINMSCLFIFAFLSSDTPVYFIVANLVLCGIGFGLFAPPNSNAVMGAVEKSMYGMAASAIGSMRMIGQSMSMAIAALILSGYVGSVQMSLAPPHLLLTGIRVAFAVFGCVCLLGTIAAWQREKPKPL